MNQRSYRPHLAKGILFTALTLMAFLMYSQARTMGGEIGLHAVAAGYAFILAAFAVAVPGALLLLLLPKRWIGDHALAHPHVRPVVYQGQAGRLVLAIALLFGTPLFLGSTAAEMAILADEVSFLREAEQAAHRDGRTAFNRPRAWPNESGALLWEKSRGTWATD